MKKLSLRKKLILLFVLTSTLPIILLGLYDLYNMKSVLYENTDFFVSENLDRVDDNLNICLDSYNDLLYQIYTNDDLVEWVDNLNDGVNEAVTTNQMRRFLRGLFYAKDYVRSITVITEEGEIITYDQMTPATYENSWIKNYSLSLDEMYYRVSGDNHTVFFDTEYGTTFANEDFYLFHMAHRIVDYKKPYRRNGIVILSVDERFLQDILQTNSNKADESPDFNCLIGRKGQIISCPDSSLIGTYVIPPTISEKYTEEERNKAYSSFIKKNGDVKPYTNVYSYYDEALGWEIVEPIDQSSLMSEMNKKESIIVLASFVLLLATILALRDVLAKEKETQDEQRNAEIKALEAQINPHFLYNTLDTINWMAIDKDEFDISNAINSLAQILRYAISKSEEMVPLHDEVEWLKKYIYLQQYRLKNKFVCRVEAAPEIMNVKIHKLLLQPFIENAIIHGFSKNQEEYILDVSLSEENEGIKIVIKDNGCGIAKEALEKLNRGENVTDDNKNHLGVKNALTRLHMYYQSQEKVSIESEEGIGTTIMLWIPKA